MRALPIGALGAFASLLLAACADNPSPPGTNPHPGVEAGAPAPDAMSSTSGSDAPMAIDTGVEPMRDAEAGVTPGKDAGDAVGPDACVDCNTPDAGCAGSCSSHGHCDLSQCVCDSGYAGSDCELCAMGFAHAGGSTSCTPASCPANQILCAEGDRQCAGNQQRDCVVDTDGCAAFGAFAGCAAGGCLCPSADPKVLIQQWGTSKSDLVNGLGIGPDGEALVTGMVGGALDGQMFVGVLDLFLAGRFVDGAPGHDDWTRHFGSDQSDTGRDLAVDPMGNMFVAGEIGGMVDGKNVLGGPDASLTRWNMDRTRAWTALWGSTTLDATAAVARHPSGDLFVVGYTFGDAESGKVNAGQEDAMLTRVTASGDVLWTHQWGGAGSDTAQAIAIDDDGNLYVGGTTAGEAFCSKLDENGASDWEVRWSSGGLPIVLGLVVLGDGSVIVAGHAYEMPGAPGAGSAFVSQVDAQGQITWTKRFGVSMTDYARAIALAPDGDVVIAGEVAGELVPGSSRGGDDAFLQKRKPDGSVVWTKQLGTLGAERGNAVAVAPDGTTYLGGSTSGAFDGYLNQGETDSYLIVVGP